MIDPLDLHAYADGELSVEDKARVEQAIAGSLEASKELESIRGLKSCLSTKMEQPSYGNAWNACLDRLDDLDRVKKAETFVGKYAWALSCLLFLVIVAGGTWNRTHGSSLKMGSVASSLSDLLPLQTRSSSSGQLRQYVPTLRIESKDIIATAIAERPEGQLQLFRLRAPFGDVDLMVVPSVGNIDGTPIGDGFIEAQVNGQNCVAWLDSGKAYLVIGNFDTGTLKGYAQSIYR